MSSCTDSAKGCGICVGGIAFILTHPVAGLLAQPVLGVKAGYHAIFLNYHWRHSKNEAGVALCNDYASPNVPKYMHKTTPFTAKDLTFLEQEEKRIEDREKMTTTLKWMRGLAKCIIPIGGLIWAACTEIEAGGSMPMVCEGCMGHEDHWTDAEAIRWHISKLKGGLAQRDITYLSQSSSV